MTTYKAANQTKYDAGGSGDNIIDDGYIKSVEKIWMDTFTMATLLTSNDTIQIATIPANKKITGVDVYFDAITPTTCTIDVGISGDTDKFIDGANVVRAEGIDGAIAAVESVHMDHIDGPAFVTTAETDILLSLGSTVDVSATAGTGKITTIVRYT